jgi:hypothetical protein
MRGVGADQHEYDLPVHFKGQLIETSFHFENETRNLSPLGNDNGYQHLWKKGVSAPITGSAEASWLLNDAFYTLTLASNAPVSAVYAELGSNDPNHNLRREQALIFRTKGTDVSYVSIYEKHGRYDSDNEVTVYDGTTVVEIKIAKVDAATVYSIQTELAGDIFIIVADETVADRAHSIEINNEIIQWTGPIHVHR